MVECTTANLADLPSFSMILETENLVNADLEGLSLALQSLLAQDLPPSAAQEVLVIDSGDVPADLIAQLRQQYPWIRVHRTDVPMEYYEAKMLGANLAQGEVVVYCDSDCLYEPHWLRTLVSTFADSSINVVAGETATQGLGPYGTAMALGYIFPQYSGDRGLHPTSQYFLNNVAFRRNFLLANPIPTDLPLYRGNCLIHARKLTQAGQQIWRQPQARAGHAAPNGLSHFFWRFLLIGHDAYWQQRLIREARIPASRRGERYFDPISGQKSKLGVFKQRLWGIVAEDWRHLLFLPLALPVLLTSTLLIVVGNLITRFQPHYLLEAYNQLLTLGDQTIAFDPQPPTTPVNPPAKGTHAPYH